MPQWLSLMIESIDKFNVFSCSKSVGWLQMPLVFFHIDLSFMDHGRMSEWRTGILYLNTNNGYTLFEDGTKIESVANRFISFPSAMSHKGTTCSDENKRIILNFNYFPK